MVDRCVGWALAAVQPVTKETDKHIGTHTMSSEIETIGTNNVRESTYVRTMNQRALDMVESVDTFGSFLWPRHAEPAYSFPFPFSFLCISFYDELLLVLATNVEYNKKYCNK